MEMVVLVNEQGQAVGTMEKMSAHQNGGHLHRAFSGFVFNKKGELLIQKRASTKYHNPNIWANTVCSHPRENETPTQGANRRIYEELGFHAKFTEIGEFIYRATFPNGLTEHEYDHVCVAEYNEEPIKPNPDEVADFRFISRADLIAEIKKTPENFSFWLREILKREIL